MENVSPHPCGARTGGGRPAMAVHVPDVHGGGLHEPPVISVEGSAHCHCDTAMQDGQSGCAAFGGGRAAPTAALRLHAEGIAIASLGCTGGDAPTPIGAMKEASHLGAAVTGRTIMRASSAGVTAAWLETAGQCGFDPHAPRRAGQASVTPAACMPDSAASSEPSRSMPRDAASMTSAW